MCVCVCEGERERERERERDFIEKVRNYDGKNKNKASWWNVDYSVELFKFLEFVIVHHVMLSKHTSRRLVCVTIDRVHIL